MTSLSSEEREQLSPVWDLSQERAFTMSLINQRISFFLAFFSLVVGGALNAKAQLHMNIILVIGSILLWFLWFPIHYTQIRLNRLMTLIKSDETHPYTVITKGMPRRQLRVSAYIVYSLTTFCCLVLTIGTIFAVVGLLKIAP